MMTGKDWRLGKGKRRERIHLVVLTSMHDKHASDTPVQQLSHHKDSMVASFRTTTTTCMQNSHTGAMGNRTLPTLPPSIPNKVMVAIRVMCD